MRKPSHNPTFINFRWSKMLLPELSPDLLNQYFHLRSFLNWLPINKQNSFNIATLTYKVEGTVYATTNLSLQFNFLPPFQSSTLCNYPLQLHKSGTKYLLPLELHHHSTVSNTTLKPITSQFHEIPTHPATAHTSDFFLTLVHH